MRKTARLGEPPFFRSPTTAPIIRFLSLPAAECRACMINAPGHRLADTNRLSRD